jgi:hypothetical protein
LKEQRDIIIEERNTEREIRLIIRQRQKAANESQSAFLKDRIGMINDELTKTVRDESILEKAYIDEKRRLVKDQKNFANDQIGEINEHLRSDWENDAYRLKAVDDLKRDIRFQVVKRKNAFGPQ